MKLTSSLLFIMAFASCKIYYITPESFKEQITSTVPFRLKNEASSYLASKLEVIRCQDKNGRKIALQNSPSVEARFVEKNGKKKTYYFNTVVFQNDTITGGKSMFLPQLRSGILLDSVVRIEVQDGGKKFKSAGHAY